MTIIRDFKGIKEDVTKLPNLSNIINEFEQSSALHEGVYLREAFDKNLVLKLNLLNSKIKDKREIKDKFEILCYHLGLLRTIQLTKDYSSVKRIINQFIRNEYTNINIIISDIKNLDKDIDDLYKSYSELINKIPRSLDLKLCNEFNYQGHIQKLKNLNEKHKQLIFEMSSLFIKLTRNLLRDKEFRECFNSNKNAKL
jgi:hypothetical protein